MYAPSQHILAASSWAPGSSFLFGEYAVTKGGIALVIPLNHGVQVQCRLLGHSQSDLSTILQEFISGSVDVQIRGPLGMDRWQESFQESFQSGREKIQGKYEYCKSALTQWCQYFRLKQKPKPNNRVFSLEIESSTEFDLQWGLGSSAAFLVAFLSALNLLFKAQLSKQQLFLLARSACHCVQGGGSCGDIAASLIQKPILFGQALSQSSCLEKHDHELGAFFKQVETPLCDFSQALYSYNLSEPRSFKGAYYYALEEAALQFLSSLELTWIYMGYKTTTAQMLGKIEITHEEILLSNKIVSKAFSAASSCDLNKWLEAFTEAQQLLERLGCCDATMARYVEALFDEDQGFAPIKISGSGHGDCLIAIGIEEKAIRVARTQNQPGLKELPGIAIGKNKTL